MRPVLLHLLIFATCLSLAIPAGAQFQRQFGTNLDETFNKVIKSGTNYYVLGTAEITNGQPPRATVTRLNAAGELQWTLSVNTASQWNDAVLTPNGDLLVVGRSLPDDNTSRAIMGRVTATGSFAWLRSYDQPNRDGFDRIARNPVPQTGTHPYYVLGHQLQALPAVDDVFLMNIDENGDINWKKIYLSTADDEFTNVLLAMPNGDLILAGHRGGEGLVMRADNTGALFNGATPSQPFTFIDVASAGGAGFYAVGYNFQQEKVQLISFDVDLFNQWEVTVNGFTAVNNVFTAAGSVFLGGRKVREACARMSVGAGGPTLTWVKTLDNGVLTQTSSHLSFLSPAQIAYVDGRTVETGGFGQNCAFMSVSDLELNSCMTEVEDGVSLTQVSTLFNGPQLPEIEFYDEPMGADLTGGPRTWQQGNACPDPANAIIIGVKYKTCEGLPYSDQTPIAGWVIQLMNSQGAIIGEQVTGADGSYAFDGLPAGQYIVKEVAQPGWTPNVPASGQLAVTLAASEQRIVNFGNCPPPQLFCACPAGSLPANNNLAANGDFSGSNTGFSSGYTFSNSSPLQPGQYWVGSNPSQINAGFTSCGDHTTGSGNMLVVNGGASTSSTIWCQTYTVTPNSSYLFEVWVASLTSASPANLMLFVNNVSYGAGFFASGTSCNWEKYCTLWESGTNTSVTLCLVDLNTAGTGNDFALDDISFRRCISTFGHVIGRVYETCDALPYTNQPVLPGWTVQLLDDTGTVLAEQVTGANGDYAFADLPLGLYYCRVVNQPGWTPNVPPSGEYIANLDTPGETILDFGLCPLSPPCDVTINTIYVDNCGHVQLDAVASGPSAYSYQWCSGESTQMLDLMLPCGEHDFCVSVTCADGSVASDAITVVVSDNIPPNIVCPQNVQLDCFSPTTPSATGFASATDNCNFPLVTYMDVVTGSQPCDQLIVRTWKAEDWCNNISTCVQTITVMDNVAPTINCPQDMTFTALDPNCDMPVFGIHSLGATDNCGTPTVTYAISGATTASGSGDASGTTFSSGTSTVTYTATDLCNNTSSCSFDVTIDCDTCACLGFQNMEFYNFLSGPNLPAFCDSTTIMLPCIGSDALYWFQWGLLCSDPLCQQSYSYSIVPASGGPALISGTVPLGSPPFLNFAYNQLSGPGNYTIILTGHCGTDSCVCNINFSVPDCCDCGGFSDMTYRPTQGIMNLSFMCGDTMGVVCDQVFLPQVGGLFQCVGSSCTSSNLIQWTLTDPQGNVIQSSSAPIIASPGFNFTLDPTWFVQPGIYALTMTGMCGGQPCTPCVLYLESLGCNCHCGNFSNMYLRSANAPPGVAVNCGEAPVQVDCPSSNLSLQFTGVFECENGNVCPDSALVNWVLIRLPNDIVATGNMIASPFFGLSILPSWYAVPGTYEIQLSGTCGSDSCACSIQFTVDCPEACVCDSDDFEEDLNRGFSTTLFDNSCEACFASILMTDCDVIEWSIDGVSYGSSIGGMMFFHTFTSAGTYSVTMSVTRFNADGSVCQFGTFTQTVIVTCGSNDCGNSVFINSDFNMGAVPGGMNSGGATQGWSSISGEPIVVEGETGSTDAWSIDLDGNFSSSSILTTLDPVCLEKTAGDATLRFKIKQGGIKGMLVLVLYRTDAFEAGDCNPETCYAIEDSKWTQELHLNQWMQLTFPYDLSDWAVSDDCGDMPSVSVRPALYVLNHLSDDQGGMVTRTIISIDNFCLDGMLVDLDYLNNKQIFHLYPNPNTGQFTLDWQGAPWPDGRVEIAGPLGQTLRSFSVPEGAGQMEVQIADLPTGMYFVKVLSEGRVVKVMRVVKR